MLEESEIQSLKLCSYWSIHGWGHRDYGLGPSATIAKERGAEFELTEIFGMKKYYRPVDKESRVILGKAHRDLISELGFNSEGRYLAFLATKVDSPEDILHFL